jgi:cytochrome b561
MMDSTAGTHAKASSTILWTILIFFGSMAISLFVDGLAISLRVWLENRIGSPGLSALAYNSVHYFLYQLAVILLLIGILGRVRVSGIRAAVLLLTLTAGKLAGRAVAEQPPAPSPSPLMFSIVVSAALSASAIVLAEDLLNNGKSGKSALPYSLGSITFIAVTLWFAAFPLIDRFGSLDLSNSSRIGMVLTLVVLGYMETKGSTAKWTFLPVVTMTAYLTVALFVSTLLSDLMMSTRTIATLPAQELVLYLASRVPLAFFLSMIAISGTFIRRLSVSRLDQRWSHLVNK